MGFAYLLYRANNKIADKPNALVRILFALRAIVITIVSFLLLSPLLKFVSREVEKPVIIWLQDNSASIVQSPTSDKQQSAYTDGIEKLKDELGDDFEFQTYSFDSKLNDTFKLDFSGKETDIAGALNEINNIYLNRNVGALVLATDGIYNKGTNPLYTVNQLKAPLFTIALGDTLTRSDLIIRAVNHNQLAYLNNTFPVEVVLDARKLEGKSSILNIEKDGQVIASQPFTISSPGYIQNFSFQLKASQPGMQRYRVSVAAVEGEITRENNQRDFFIEVIDSRQKILILADAPSPDVAAIRQTLQSNEHYETDVHLAGNFSGTVKGYSLIILHQLPGRTNPQNVITEASNLGIPLFFICAPNTNSGALNTQQSLVQIQGMRGNRNEAAPKLNNDFALFTLSDELKKSISRFEPVSVPNAAYRVNPGASVLLTQRIGSVDTDYPLLLFASGEQKSGILLGEGIWRWRLHVYQEKQSHELFDELIFKIVQFLSVRNERKNFRIVSRNSFAENERVTFEAEVYNASYELVNSPDVFLNVIDENKRKYPFTFSKTSNAYRLDAGLFPPGEYKFEASTNLGGKTLAAQGTFVIKPVVAEVTNTTADHGMLQTLASRNGGEMIRAENLMQLAEKIKSREDVKSVSHSDIRLKDLISLKWIFFLILGLISTEWFLRKRNGAY